MSVKSYQRYPLEFKQSSVKLANESDAPITQIARELGIKSKPRE